MTTEEQLAKAAIAAARHAHAPYSKFTVGAALQTAEGQVFSGCNIENSSYGLTICAERVAVFNAMTAGSRNFTMLAIASAGAVPPCGACRQVLAEFAESLPILLVELTTAEIKATNLTELLPNAFRFEKK